MKENFFKDLSIAVITTKQIIDAGSDIVYVTHDLQDGGWQFLCKNFIKADGRVISLGNILTLDSSLNDLSDLEAGWSAKRENKGTDWIRYIEKA